MADERKFCKKGKAYVMPNPYNRYEERPDRCIYMKDRYSSICDRCVMYINPQKTK